MDGELIRVLFALLRFEIKGTKLCEDDKNLITEDMLPALYKLSKKHDLAHLVGDALDRNGLLLDGSDAKKRFLQERNMAVYRYEQLRYELDCICGVLEETKIPFIPLKGAVIRQYYPEPWMRTSCDIDILVEERKLEAAVEVIKTRLGYDTEGEKTSHDIPLYSQGGVLVELHFGLLEDEERENVALSQIWEHTFTKEGVQFHRIITKEAFYAYHIAHMMKHFEIGGCGIKPFIDLWVLDQTIIEEEKTQKLLTLMGAKEFARMAHRLSKAMAGEIEYERFTFAMQDYIVRGGVYGSKDNLVVARQTKQGGKGKYILRRVFPSYKTLAMQNPFLKKCPILYPFYILRRWALLLFDKTVQERSKQELKIIKDLKKDEQITQEELFKQLGIR